MTASIDCKCGGSTLGNARGFSLVRDIFSTNPDYRYVIVSAPAGVSDLLLEANAWAKSPESYKVHTLEIDANYRKVENIFRDILLGLGFLGTDLERTVCTVLNTARISLKRPSRHEFAVSRGEYLSAKIMAKLLGWKFIDAANLLVFNDDRTVNFERSTPKTIQALSHRPHAVIGGWYGRLQNGQICVSGRGGSDITLSAICYIMKASAAVKLTDTRLRVTDPRIVTDAQTVDYSTPEELEELGSHGAKIFNPDAIGPLSDAAIPLYIRYTKEPEHPGTLIQASPGVVSHPITGIASSKSYTAITVVKRRMNRKVGYVERVARALGKRGLPFEQVATGTNIVSVLLKTNLIEDILDDVVEEIRLSCMFDWLRGTTDSGDEPDDMKIMHNIALITVVGRGMVHHLGTAGRIFTALGKAKVNVILIDQPVMELTIVIGVEDSDEYSAVNAIYTEFFGEEEK
jgi:aspartate kinase